MQGAVLRCVGPPPAGKISHRVTLEKVTAVEVNNNDDDDDDGRQAAVTLFTKSRVIQTGQSTLTHTLSFRTMPHMLHYAAPNEIKPLLFV